MPLRVLALQQTRWGSRQEVAPRRPLRALQQTHWGSRQEAAPRRPLRALQQTRWGSRQEAAPRSTPRAGGPSGRWVPPGTTPKPPQCLGPGSCSCIIGKRVLAGLSPREARGRAEASESERAASGLGTPCWWWQPGRHGGHPSHPGASASRAVCHSTSGPADAQRGAGEMLPWKSWGGRCLRLR